MNSQKCLRCFVLFLIQTGGSSARVQRGSSRVGFLPSQVKPPTDVPVDLTKELFDAVEDVQTFTLQPSQLAVVIASYDKTIGRIHLLVCNTVFYSGTKLKELSHLVQHNKQYHMEVLFNSFHDSNGHTLGFHPQT